MKAGSLLVAIVGGSASGKSWLAGQLQSILGDYAARLSLDDFYIDRSHLSPAKRARVNYDHPRAIDWPCMERVLRDCRAGHIAKVPSYDFATHSRRAKFRRLEPRPILLMEGLWLLHRASLRRMIGFSIFIDCPKGIRLERRIARDVALRGRTHEFVQRQFVQYVEPMHTLHVLPQARWADFHLQTPIRKKDLSRIVDELRKRSSVHVKAGRARSPSAPT